MVTSVKYCEYFNVDETYFPCIDESAINAGVPWEGTYPHDTFIEMLNDVDKMLGGTTKRSLWIHGSYGTGKSRCAYALKKILEAPEEEVRAYWDRYAPLRENNAALLNKLLGHKEHGIITAYRYASGGITSPQLLFLAIQESIRESLNRIPGSYKGENTLKESIITWMQDPVHNNFINDLLKKPEWMAEFSQSTADEIINTLKKNSEVTELMEKIFKLSAKEGIVALSLTSDSLCKWIKDIVNGNNSKIVLIWDEFSGFFRQNRNSLDEFQKIVSLCEETHFYFVIVTHPISSIAGAAVSKDDPMSIVQQRFTRVEINLPPNIAFDLIGHAFSVIPAAKSQWESMTSDLGAMVVTSCNAVMKATNVNDPAVMRHMLPIHPMAALVLKNIASSFQSNQRSMFDFIKTPKNLDVKAFQWFIQNNSPLSDRPLLTVDMLWDFFYEKGKDYLSSDIRLILDTFPQQTNLLEKEKVVLKTILIMQAVDQRLGGAIPLLKPTEQNLSYAFEGDYQEYESGCKNIAKTLVTKGILISTPTADGKKAYAVAVFAGDGAKIDKYKTDIRKTVTITKLVEEGTDLATSLNLPVALKLRYSPSIDSGALPVVTTANFTKTMESLKDKDADWHFYAVLALAKTDEEAQKFRSMIKQAVGKEEYKNIVVIDALSMPLGLEEFERYVDYSSMSLYYQGNNNQQSKDNARKAKDVLNITWSERINKGSFIVWTYSYQEGERASTVADVHTMLQTVILSRFRYVFDFTKGITENQLKLTNAKQSARVGLGDMEIKGVISGCEKSVLGKVWTRKNYWDDSDLDKEPITVIKKDLNNLIESAFKKDGKISIGDIYDYLEKKYGFAPCNLTAFIIGFLLRDYSGDPYRYMDADGHAEALRPEKVSEMIANYMGKAQKTSYIVSLTESEKAFYKMTNEAWGLGDDLCTSPAQAGMRVQNRIRDFGYPLWCLSEVDTQGVYDIVKKYIDLVQSDNDKAHDIANDLGEIALQRPASAERLKELLTAEKCREGMSSFLEVFEDGRLIKLAGNIGAADHLLDDVKELFKVKHSAKWVQETGEDEIRKLIVEYEVIKETNELLNISNHTKETTFNSWRETLKFIGICGESICHQFPGLSKLIGCLLKIARSEDFLPENMLELLNELSRHKMEMRDLLGDTTGLFMKIYAPYLEGYSRSECEEIKDSIKVDMFQLSATKGNAEVKKASEEYRRKRVKDQLNKYWVDQTGGTKNPRQWSEIYRTPILCCVGEEIYGEAKKTFSVLNDDSSSEGEIKSALNFLQTADFFKQINNSEYRDNCFTKYIIGGYAAILPDINTIRTALEVLPVDVYDWADDPTVRSKIQCMAKAEYNAGWNDKAKNIINSMDDIGQLRSWLKNLVDKDMELGIKIISNGGR